MKKILVALFLMLTLVSFSRAEEYAWKGRWISKEAQCRPNTWMAFKKVVQLDQVPASLEARIAVDSRYWMWINGEMVVREGALKRGPAIGDTYYDKVEIAPYLRAGENVITVLVWHFGKSGFSHMNSGTCALLFDAVAPGVEIVSDRSWRGTALATVFTTAEGPEPNYRLPESNIRYDARILPEDWYKSTEGRPFSSVIEMGFAPGQAPMGRLVERPIPQWKDFGLKHYEAVRQSRDTVYCRVPYNCHVAPWLKVDAPEGRVIRIETDHRIVTGAECVRAEYVTKAGVQEFECYGWMNGEEVKYIVPEDVKVLDVQYRETGFDTEFTGRFTCDDDFLNDYWKRAQRTIDQAGSQNDITRGASFTAEE